MDFVLDFEHPVVEIRKRVDRLREIEGESGSDLSASIAQLEAQANKLQAQIFSGLSTWQRTQLSRHPGRPYTLDLVERLFTDWVELHGDRAGHDDHSIVTGMARFGGVPVAVIGHQKGRNTRDNIRRNFGMPRPEGYRKALRIMEMANRFGRPIITFIDTPGAYPGIEAEERGQAEAIARNIMEMAAFTVPVICCVVGEGGSGGALAIGVGNRVIMMEHATYSVISPEGCAAILWRDRAEAPTAAAALRITAQDCLRFSVCDEVVTEPAGGAHLNAEAAMDALGQTLGRHLTELRRLSPADLREDRYRRFRALGEFEDQARVGATEDSIGAPA
jgi:acetyl-CoA carboxylase carboxyl transferase subunit alpha